MTQFSDLSNYSDQLNSPSSPPTTVKRSDREMDDLLPSKLRHKRNYQQFSSSSSPQTTTSSSPFGNHSNELSAYLAPSSPVPLSSSKLSLPPSSPPLSSHLEQLEQEEDSEEIESFAPQFTAVPHVLSTQNNNNNTTTRQPTLSPRKKQKLAPTPTDTTISLEFGTLYQFGRKAKKPQHSASFDSYAPLPARTQTILLPPSAKNASRLHCTVSLLSDTRLSIKVMGQNGMKVDGKLWDRGTERELQVVGGQIVELAFWGWGISVVIPGGEDEEEPINLEEQIPVEPMAKVDKTARPKTKIIMRPLIATTPARP
ncbi:hypothetical protein P7C70_g9216, partial [Phenoliferia sp. Uapishka_3]